MNDSHTEKDIRELPGTYHDGEPSDPATDPDHSHSLSWRDISRVLFVAAAGCTTDRSVDFPRIASRDATSFPRYAHEKSLEYKKAGNGSGEWVGVSTEAQ